MSDNNPDLTALKRLCKEAAESTKEALAVKTHFESITPTRELPGVLEKVHETEIKLTIGEVLAIAACIVKLGEENEQLRKRLKKAVMAGFDAGKFVGSCETSRRHKEKTKRSEPC